MNPTKKQRTLSKPEQEAADSVVSNNPAQLMNCENNALELISKHIKTESPDNFRANRSLITRWCLAYDRVAETDKVTTLCVMPDSTKPTSEELKSRFVRDIDIDTAVNIRHAPNIDAPNGPDLKDLEDHYPNVTQLFLSHKYFSQCWIENLTHFSLFEDQSVQRDLSVYSNALNKMTSLRSLDLNGSFFAAYPKMKPTLARLEQLSVNCLSSIESLREYAEYPPHVPHFIALSDLIPKCTRFWFVQRAEPCNLHYWEKLTPDWIPRLTHFGMNIFPNEEFTRNERDERVQLSNCTLARFCLPGLAPDLQVFHLLDSMISLNPLVVRHIAGMTNLEEINIGVVLDYRLYRIGREGNLKSWNKVHTLGLTVRRILRPPLFFEDSQLVEIISTIAPNVKHLSLCFTDHHKPLFPVCEHRLFEKLSDASATELISFKISNGRFLYYEGKRDEPGEPFRTTMTQEAQDNLDNLRRRLRPNRGPVIEVASEDEDDEEDEEEENNHENEDNVEEEDDAEEEDEDDQEDSDQEDSDQEDRDQEDRVLEDRDQKDRDQEDRVQEDRDQEDRVLEDHDQEDTEDEIEQAEEEKVAME